MHQGGLDDGTDALEWGHLVKNSCCLFQGFWRLMRYSPKTNMAMANPPFFHRRCIFKWLLYSHCHVRFLGRTKNDSYAIIKMGRLIPGSILFRLLLGVRKSPENLLSSPLKDMMGLETKIRLPFWDCLVSRGLCYKLPGSKKEDFLHF